MAVWSRGLLESTFQETVPSQYDYVAFSYYNDSNDGMGLTRTDFESGSASVSLLNPGQALNGLAAALGAVRRTLRTSRAVLRGQPQIKQREPTRIFVSGMQGFGDNLLQRPKVRALTKRYDEVYVQTPCPFVYHDIPGLRFVPMDNPFRTQTKHSAAYPTSTWTPRPAGIPVSRPSYYVLTAGGPGNQERRDAMFADYSPDNAMTLPIKPEWIAEAKKYLADIQIQKPICVVRRPTLRTEWPCPARNPLACYFQNLMGHYRDQYFFVSVADIAEGEEWFDGDVHGFDVCFDHGELSLQAYFGLLSLADMQITTPTLGMVAGIAARCPTFTVWGGLIGPDFILDDKMGLDLHAYAAPAPTCECLRPDHDCQKAIDDQRLLGAFDSFRTRTQPCRYPAAQVQGYAGIGDNLHQRPYVRHLAEKYERVYVLTPCPELYWDIPQARPIALEAEPPEPVDRRTWRTQWHDPRGTVASACRAAVGNAYAFEFPVKREWLVAARRVLDALDTQGKPICLIHRPAVRAAWPCESRNPAPEHFQEAVDAVAGQYHVISLADVSDGNEVFTADVTGIDTRFEQGELPLITVFGLAQLADMIVTYPSLFLLLGIAIRTPTLCVFGGCAKPDIILDPVMGLNRCAWAAPEPFCHCGEMDHECNKRIEPGLVVERVAELQARASVSQAVIVAIPPGIGDIHWIALFLESFRKRHNIERLTVAVNVDWRHTYSIEFLRLLPFVDDVVQVDPAKYAFGWQWHKPYAEREWIRRDAGIPPNTDFLIDANSPLESGVRIEDAFPEYRMNWDYEVRLPDTALANADGIRQAVGGTLVCCYASSIGANANWNGGAFTADHWIALGRLLREQTGCLPVMLAAEWDMDFARAIYVADHKPGAVPAFYWEAAGKTDVANCLALIKQSRAFVGFPSGLPIMATHFRVPTVMFWMREAIWHSHGFDKRFQTAWVAPDTLAEGLYHPILFGSPDATPEAIVGKLRGALK